MTRSSDDGTPGNPLLAPRDPPQLAGLVPDTARRDVFAFRV